MMNQNNQTISKRISTVLQSVEPVIQYVSDPRWDERRQDPDSCDFLLGNPHEFPLPGITAALQKWLPPQNENWFAYKMSESRSQEIVAAALSKSHHQSFDAQYITMTTGAFAGLSAVLALTIDPGDEVIYISPPWFFYEMLIAAHGGQPVSVPCDRATFDLDLTAIQRAITPKTRGIIINTPNNPTGRIYPPETLRELASLLTQASREHGRTIYLYSDEAYNHIVFEGAAFHSPTAYYPNTFLIYTYGKTLLIPGQRMGYVALPPAMPERDDLRHGLIGALVMLGYAFPNALLQHALEDLEGQSIDVAHLQAKRDRLVGELRGMGYELNVPEGTFYLLVRSPLEDDLAYTERLGEQKVYCLPGAIFEMPGSFRISLTATDAMIERAVPRFREVIEAVRARDVSRAK
jgi:aspartate aminotransferase